jgi:DNA-binding transcriptional MerR regulator
MNDQTNTISIGELAKQFDVTARAIRFYEEQGLLHPVREGTHRIYFAKDTVRLKLILRGKRLGFSLAEIKTLFALYDTDPNSTVQLETMLELTQQKRETLNQQLHDIKTLLAELDEVEARCKEELNELTQQSGDSSHA